MPAIDASPSTHLVLITGDGLEVAGAPQEVGKLLQDAVRSSPGTLAWLSEADGGDLVGINPQHVVTVRAAAGETEP